MQDEEILSEAILEEMPVKSQHPLRNVHETRLSTRAKARLRELWPHDIPMLEHFLYSFHPQSLYSWQHEQLTSRQGDQGQWMRD